MSDKRRLKACVEAWPDCETGEYNPKCCRFPKSCSATVYREEYVGEADLEPERVLPTVNPEVVDWPGLAQAAVEEAERWKERWRATVEDATQQRERADTAEAEIERLRTGIESEIEALATLAKQAVGLDFDPAQKARSIAYRIAERDLRALLEGGTS